MIQARIIVLRRSLVDEKTLEGHTDSVSCLIKLNERQIASGSWDASIRIWDSVDGNCLKTHEGHTNYVWCLIKLNERQIASGSFDSSIRIWDFVTGNCLKTLQGHTGYFFLPHQAN